MLVDFSEVSTKYLNREDIKSTLVWCSDLYNPGHVHVSYNQQKTFLANKI